MTGPIRPLAMGKIQPQPSIPALPQRERLLILAELTALTALSWLYLVRMPMSASDFGAMGARIAAPIPVSVVSLWLVFMMWAVMMVAMMLPTAAPMILMYAKIARGREGGPISRAWMFAGGYLAVWTLFSAAATAAQAMLQHATILSDGLTTSRVAGAVILVLAGGYQLTPLKQACLGYCQSPVAFFMTNWRDGPVGAFRMGLMHGSFCLGCCWMLMLLLFAAGVMNLVWVAAIAAFVLIEKLTPYPRAIANVSGAALIASGLVLAFYG
jgi:predicted metal-binding membrane protein